LYGPFVYKEPTLHDGEVEILEIPSRPQTSSALTPNPVKLWPLQPSSPSLRLRKPLVEPSHGKPICDRPLISVRCGMRSIFMLGITRLRTCISSLHGVTFRKGYISQTRSTARNKGFLCTDYNSIQIPSDHYIRIQNKATRKLKGINKLCLYTESQIIMSSNTSHSPRSGRETQQSYVCDQCYRCKVKCSREKPSCTRCQRSNRSCTYSLGMWKGQPKSSQRKHRERELDNHPGPDSYATTGRDSYSPIHVLILTYLKEGFPTFEETSNFPQDYHKPGDNCASDQDQHYGHLLDDMKDPNSDMDNFLHLTAVDGLDTSMLDLNHPFPSWDEHLGFITKEGILPPCTNFEATPLAIRRPESLNLNHDTRIGSGPCTGPMSSAKSCSGDLSPVENCSDGFDQPNSLNQSQNSSPHKTHSQEPGPISEQTLIKRRSSHKELQRAHPYANTHHHSRSSISIRSLAEDQGKFGTITPAPTPDPESKPVSPHGLIAPTPITLYQTPPDIDAQDPRVPGNNTSCTCLYLTIQSLESLQPFSSKLWSTPGGSLSIIMSALSTCEQVIRCPCRGSCWAALRCLFIMQEAYQVFQQLQDHQVGRDGINNSPGLDTSHISPLVSRSGEKDLDFGREEICREVMRAVMILAGLEMLLCSLSSSTAKRSADSLSLRTISEDLSKQYKALLSVQEI
jgi:hypothetical protein